MQCLQELWGSSGFSRAQRTLRARQASQPMGQMQVSVRFYKLGRAKRREEGLAVRRAHGNVDRADSDDKKEIDLLWDCLLHVINGQVSITSNNGNGERDVSNMDKVCFCEEDAGNAGTVGLKDARCGVRRYRSTNGKVGERGQGGGRGQTSGSHTFVLLATVPW